MPRFFVEPEAICEGHATVAGGDAYHIARSLRMAVGDEITLADGSGKEYLCRLTKIRDEECTAEVISEEIGHSESPAEITLYKTPQSRENRKADRKATAHRRGSGKAVRQGKTAHRQRAYQLQESAGGGRDGRALTLLL